MNEQELRTYAEDAEEVVRHLNTVAEKSLNGSGQYPDRAVVEIRNVSRRFLDKAKTYASTAPTPSAALPVEGAGPGDDETLFLEWANKNGLDTERCDLRGHFISPPTTNARWAWDAAVAAEREAAALRDTLAGYTHDAAPASVTAASVWVLQDRGNREVVGVYGSEAAARQAIEPDRDMKQYPDNPDYYHVEELPIESPASPASVTGPQEPAAEALPANLRTRLLTEMSRMVSEGEANELRDNGGHGDFDAGAGQGRAFLAAEILAAFPTEPAASIPVGGTPPSEWISVDERLPEVKPVLHNHFRSHYSELVLVVQNSKVQDSLFYCDKQNVWRRVGGGGYAVEGITHWQPLPAAPSDGK